VVHPLVGELTLDWDAYRMPGAAPGLMIVAYTAEEGSPDRERLQLLARLVDTPAQWQCPPGNRDPQPHVTGVRRAPETAAKEPGCPTTTAASPKIDEDIDLGRQV
jgi:MmyB-like transcription regulator ligand binding domain